MTSYLHIHENKNRVRTNHEHPRSSGTGSCRAKAEGKHQNLVGQAQKSLEDYRDHHHTQVAAGEQDSCPFPKWNRQGTYGEGCRTASLSKQGGDLPSRAGPILKEMWSVGLGTQGAREIRKRKDHDVRGGWVPKTGYLKRKVPLLKINRRKT